MDTSKFYGSKFFRLAIQYMNKCSRLSILNLLPLNFLGWLCSRTIKERETTIPYSFSVHRPYYIELTSKYIRDSLSDAITFLSFCVIFVCWRCLSINLIVRLHLLSFLRPKHWLKSCCLATVRHKSRPTESVGQLLHKCYWYIFDILIWSIDIDIYDIYR